MGAFFILHDNWLKALQIQEKTLPDRFRQGFSIMIWQAPPEPQPVSFYDASAVKVRSALSKTVRL